MSVVSDLEVARKLSSIAKSAESRGIHFDMSFRRVKQLLNTKKCFISGVELNRIPNDKRQLTFDRLDNDLGYIDSNVVACSLHMNQLKSAITVNEIVLLYNAINKKKNYDKRKKVIAD
jgi:hypothetical protein